MSNSISIYLKSYQMSLNEELKSITYEEQRIQIVNDQSLAFLKENEKLWDFTSKRASTIDPNKTKFLKLVYDISKKHLAAADNFSKHFTANIIFSKRQVGDLTYSIFHKSIANDVMTSQFVEDHLKTVLAYEIEDGVFRIQEETISKLGASQFSRLIDAEGNAKRLEVYRAKQVKPLKFDMKLVRTLITLQVFQPDYFLTEFKISLSSSIHIAAIKAFLCSHTYFQHLFSSGLTEAIKSHIDFTSHIQELSHPAEFYHVGFNKFLTHVLHDNGNDVDVESLGDEAMDRELSAIENQAYQAVLEDILLSKNKHVPSTTTSLKLLFFAVKHISNFSLDDKLSTSTHQELANILSSLNEDHFVSYLKRDLKSIPGRKVASLYTGLQLISPTLSSLPITELHLFENLNQLDFTSMNDDLYESLITFLREFMPNRKNETFTITLPISFMHTYKPKIESDAKTWGLKIAVLSTF